MHIYKTVEKQTTVTINEYIESRCDACNVVVVSSVDFDGEKIPARMPLIDFSDDGQSHGYRACVCKECYNKILTEMKNKIRFEYYD